MRVYKDKENTQLTEVVCNKCGRPMKVEKGILKEGCFSADILFGYFSKKDGSRHKFDLCEACYDEMIASFQIPVKETEEKELC